jgi:hypothetical protein
MICNRNILLKYFLMTVISFFSVRYIVSYKVPDEELLMVSFIIAISYALLDRLFPSLNI